MADTAASSFMENHQSEPDARAEVMQRQPTRLDGDLAATTVISTSGTAKEKIRVKGASKIRVRSKFTGTTPNATITIYPLLADESTQAATGTGSDAISTSGTEYMTDLDLKGEKFVEIEVTEDGGANNLTVSYVDVYLF